MNETGNRSPNDFDRSSCDVISNLHDSIISNILSRLTAEDAVRTSILSKEWRFKWTLIHQVNIDNTSLSAQNSDLEPIFVNFVDMVLVHSQNATSFNLVLPGWYGLSRVSDWISDVFGRTRIKSVRVVCSLGGTVLPSQQLLDCIELTNFVLRWRCLLSFPAVSCFPNLVDLQLYLVKIGMEDTHSDVMLLKFPVLVSLKLEACTWLNMKVVEINAPLLSSFDCETRYFTYRGIGEYSIRISGANLTEFCCSGGLPEDYIISNSSTILSATFSNQYEVNVDPRLLTETGLKARRLLNGMSSIEDLTLSGCMVKAIMQLNRELRLSQYDKLQRLTLCLHGTLGWSSEAICELLHAAPSLKCLTIDGVGWTGYDLDDVLEPAPNCIMHHLEEVKFKYCKAYRTTHQRLHIEKFLLENASQLRKFYISGYDSVGKNEILEKLLSIIPEASTRILSVVSD